MKYIKHLLIILVFSATGCEENILETGYENNPIDNFQALWHEFDVAYGAMEPKGINWDQLRSNYITQISESSHNRQLFNAMSGLLGELNDGHTDLYAPGLGYFRSWNRREKSYFIDHNTQDLRTVARQQTVIRQYYLKNQVESINVEGWLFFYGSIDYSGEKIGYICIPTFNLGDFPDGFIQSAIREFQERKAVIIDLRFNGGGTTEAFVKALNSFACESKIFMKSKYRNGPEHNDFSELFDHRIEPRDNCLRNNT